MARGSPFPLPTKLADGLGQESDLVRWFPTVVRPTLRLMSEGIGSSASVRRKANRIRLNGGNRANTLMNVKYAELSGWSSGFFAAIPTGYSE